MVISSNCLAFLLPQGWRSVGLEKFPDLPPTKHAWNNADFDDAKQFMLFSCAMATWCTVWTNTCNIMILLMEEILHSCTTWDAWSPINHGSSELVQDCVHQLYVYGHIPKTRSSHWYIKLQHVWKYGAGMSHGVVQPRWYFWHMLYPLRLLAVFRIPFPNVGSLEAWW